MRDPRPLGVMIARGDLAIECGWEELAEIQEEILRICAAAHIPCIWATQVLDEMARHGMPNGNGAHPGCHRGKVPSPSTGEPPSSGRAPFLFSLPHQ